MLRTFRRRVVNALITAAMITAYGSVQFAQKELTSVSGTVLDSSGAPVPGVRLSLVSEERSKTGVVRGSTLDYVESGFDGTFVTASKRGRYLLLAERNGFLSQYYGGSPSYLSPPGREASGALLDLVPGFRVVGLRIVLMRVREAAVVSGRVVNDEGVGIPGMSVEVTARMYSRFGQTLQTRVASKLTSAEGAFEFVAVPPGEYSLRVRSSTFTTTGNPPQNAFYETVTRDPIPLQLESGVEMRGLVVNMLRIPLVPVSGRVMGTTLARPLRITLEGVTTSYSLATPTSNPDGTFLVFVPVGRCLIVAAGENEIGQAVADAFLPGVDGLIIPMQPVHRIVGRVVADAGLVFSGVTIGLQRDGEQDASIPTGVANANGAFEINKVRDGTYRFFADNLPADAYVAGVRFGGQDVLSNGVDISPRVREDQQLIVSLRRSSIRVYGEVTGMPRGQNQIATVTVIPDAMTPGNIHLGRRTTTAPDGTFIVQGLAPGSYIIHAWVDLPLHAELNSEFMSTHLTQGRRIQLRDDSSPPDLNIEPVQQEKKKQ